MLFEKIASFSFPTSIVCGAGAVKLLPAALKEFGASRPLVVTDPGIVKTPILPAVADALASGGLAHALFADVLPNPVEENVVRAARMFAAERCDSIVGLGGGSALDVAKAVAVSVAHPGPLADYEAQFGGYEKIKGPIAPIVTIPTTAGTGSEVGRSAVITVPGLGRKVVIFSPLLMPRRAILDPELTVGLPPHLTAATGMDAFTHCLESLTSPEFHPLCDAIAVGGLEIIVKHLERATKDGGDVEARGWMLVAASMGAVAFQKDLGATHSLAHPLSTEFNLHHGLANAVCLPAVMRFNLAAAERHYARLAAIFGENTRLVPPKEAAEHAVSEVVRMSSRLGLPERLRECKIPRDALPALAKKAFADSCHKTNPRPCTEEDLLGLYEASW